MALFACAMGAQVHGDGAKGRGRSRGRGRAAEGSYINLAASRSAKYSNTFFITAQQFALIVVVLLFICKLLLLLLLLRLLLPPFFAYFAEEAGVQGEWRGAAASVAKKQMPEATL